jgi:hypothetical protein
MVVENLLVFSVSYVGLRKAFTQPTSYLILIFMVVENLLVFSVSYVGLRKAFTQPTSNLN